MTDHEREALLRKLQESTAEAKQLTREEAQKQLVKEGFVDDEGRLSPAYGGQAANAGR